MRIRSSAANPTAIRMATETIAMGNFPACDYHLERDREYVSAYFAGVTIFETHAFMCATCFNLYGMGLGRGKGEILLVKGA